MEITICWVQIIFQSLSVCDVVRYWWTLSGWHISRDRGCLYELLWWFLLSLCQVVYIQFAELWEKGSLSSQSFQVRMVGESWKIVWRVIVRYLSKLLEFRIQSSLQVENKIPKTVKLGQPLLSTTEYYWNIIFSIVTLIFAKDNHSRTNLFAK